MQIRLNDRGVYEARWTETVNGRPRSMRRSLRTSVRSEAEEAALRLKNGDAVTRKEPFVVDLLDLYTDTVLAAKGQERLIQKSLRQAIAAHFKGVTAAQVTDDLIESYIARRQGGKWSKGPIAPATVRRELNMLQAALNWSARKGHAKAHPTFRLPKPDPSQPRDLWMTEAQEQKLLTAVEDQSLDLQRFVRMGLAYGARKSAMLELTWAQIDFERGVIDFNRPGARITRKRRSKVPITTNIRALLLKHRAQSVAERVIDRNTDARFRELTKRIGLAWVTPHVLKHTAITLMLRAGVEMETVSVLTATDYRTLMKTYRHHCGDELLKAAERVSR